MKWIILNVMMSLFICLTGCTKDIMLTSNYKYLIIKSPEEAATILPDEFQGTRVISVSRNASRDKLFLAFGTNILIKYSGGFDLISSHGKRNIMSDDGDVSVWYNDLAKEGIVFSDGTNIKLRFNERFGVAPGGLYYYLYSSEGGTKIYSMDNRKKPLIYIANKKYYPYKLLTDMDNIYLFVMEKIKKLGKWRRDICIKMQQTDVGLSVIENFELPGAVIDMAPGGNIFMLDNGSDFYPRWYLYDVASQKKQYISARSFYGGFLNTSLVDEIQAKMTEQ